MNQTQKIIKYFAIALAFLLIFTIITTSINFISVVTNFFSNDDNILVIDIRFYHPELGSKYGINIVNPIGFSL